MLITLLNSCFTPSKFWSHHQFSRSYRHNFDHTMKMLITLLKSCFTSSKFWSHHLFSRSHRHNFHHTIKGVKQVLCSVIVNQMQKSWICGTKHADITPISIVGMIDTHNRWKSSLCGVTELWFGTKQVRLGVITTDGCKHAPRTIGPSLVRQYGMDGGVFSHTVHALVQLTWHHTVALQCCPPRWWGASSSQVYIQGVCERTLTSINSEQ